MKKSIITIVAALVVAGLAFGFAPPSQGPTIAQAVKLINDVSKKTPDIDWLMAKKGEWLSSGDQIRTGERSIAIVKFLDNSMLRVRESSELKLFGDKKEGVFNKTVSITKGQFSFDIQHQSDNEKFTFSSPTSVAAIRGTAGVMEDTPTGDMLIVIEGLVDFLNQISNKTVQVGAGQTGISNPDGTITVRASTPAETDIAQGAVNAGRNAGPEKKLDIEIKNQQGEKQKLRIRYHG